MGAGIGSLLGLSVAAGMGAPSSTPPLHWEITPWVLLGVVLLMVLVRLLGVVALALDDARSRSRALRKLECPVIPGIAPEVMAAISAAIAMHEPGPHRIVSVRHHTADAHAIEQLVHQWSLEGRRQIYSSHKVR
jgi:hypothetical protein